MSNILNLKGVKLFAIIVLAVAMLATFGMVAVQNADAATCTINSTLKQGSTGAEVVCLQTSLGGLTPDGSFGPATKAAVVAFQANEGLTADGVFGPLSKAAWLGNQGNSGAFPAGCTSAVGFSTTTGLACNATVSSGFSPAGCTSASGFSPVTGGACQAASGLPAGCTSTSGFSPSTGVSCSGGTSGGTGGLAGGAGSLDYSATSTGVQDNVKEDSSENVVAVQLEASGSDIAVTNAKFTIVDAAGAGSTHPDSYMDSFDVLLGTTKVGSIDAADLSRDGTTYTGNVSLSDAVVQEGTSHKAKLYVQANTLSTVDNTANTFTITITQLRWEDATGAMFSDSGTSITSPAPSNVFGFDDANSDDDIAIKSSSTNPLAGNILVDANSTSDEQLIGAFKLDVDSNSSDITVFSLPITLTFTASGVTTADATADSSETIVDGLRVKVGSEWYTAEATEVVIVNGAGTATYTVTDEFTINAGEAPVVGIYGTFTEQDGNYGDGEVVSADVTGSAIDAEGVDTVTVTGTFAGNDQTLSLVGNSVSNISWVKNGGGASDGSLDFLFTVTADGGDIDLVIADITGVDTVTVTGSTTAATPVLHKISGTATGSDDSYTVEDGNTANFRVRYAIGGSNGSAEVLIPSIAGEAVPDSKQLSPTIYLD